MVFKINNKNEELKYVGVLDELSFVIEISVCFSIITLFSSNGDCNFRW